MLITHQQWNLFVLIQFLIEIIIFIGIYYHYIYLRYQHKQFIYYTLFYFYIVGILFVTILPLDFQYFEFGHWNHIYNHNFLFPFRDVYYHYQGAIYNVILNILLFIPFGLLFPLIYHYSFIKTHFIGLSMIISIEIIQLLLSLFCIGFRAFDITDIMMNDLGLCIGYLIYKILKGNV